MNRRKVDILISGLVQGVGFRYFVYRKALDLGVCGWVRNRFDGQVEAVAEGDEALLKELIEEIKVGPRSAVVEDVTTRWSEADSHFTTFSVR